YEICREPPRDLSCTAGSADARRQLGGEFDCCRRAWGSHPESRCHLQRCGYRPPSDRRRGAPEHRGWEEVNAVVVHEYRPDIELLPEVERDPEAVVYNDVACNLLYACGCDLLREVEVAFERVGRSEHSVAQGVGLVVIEVRDRDGAVGL